MATANVSSIRERDIQHEIREALGLDSRVILWRNNVGAYQKDRQWIRYGLGGNGGADLVGMLRGSGRLLALELKTRSGKVSEDQRLFLQLVRTAGGFAAVVRSVEEAVGAVDRACRGESG